MRVHKRETKYGWYEGKREKKDRMNRRSKRRREEMMEVKKIRKNVEVIEENGNESKRERNEEIDD